MILRVCKRYRGSGKEQVVFQFVTKGCLQLITQTLTMYQFRILGFGSSCRRSQGPAVQKLVPSAAGL